jgi:hypothetical protein
MNERPLMTVKDVLKTISSGLWGVMEISDARDRLAHLLAEEHAARVTGSLGGGMDDHRQSCPNCPVCKALSTMGEVPFDLAEMYRGMSVETSDPLSPVLGLKKASV